jgi:hypothetical protein
MLCGDFLYDIVDDNLHEFAPLNVIDACRGAGRILAAINLKGELHSMKGNRWKKYAHI